MAAETAVHPKVKAVITVGTIVTAITAAASIANIDLPETVIAAITTVLTFAAGYLKSS